MLFLKIKINKYVTVGGEEKQPETKNLQHILFSKQRDTTHRRVSLVHFLLRTKHFIMLYILQVISTGKWNSVLLPMGSTVF